MKKIIVLALAICLVVSGCGKSDTSQKQSTEQSSETGESKQDSASENGESEAVVNEENVVYAKVTAVSDNKVTVAYGEMQTLQRPSGDKGTRPSAMPDGAAKPDGSARPSSPPDMPDGTPNPDDAKSGDKKPSGKMSMPFKENGETEELTISDDSIIQKKENQETVQGSLSDITVDTLLKIQYKEDGKTIDNIMVVSFDRGGDFQKKDETKQ